MRKTVLCVVTSVIICFSFFALSFKVFEYIAILKVENENLKKQINTITEEKAALIEGYEYEIKVMEEEINRYTID